MKTLVFTLALLPSALLAQRRGPAPIIPRPVAPTAPVTGSALGGSFLSPGFSRPLGGITPAKTPIVPTGKRASRYIGPVIYVPNAIDAFGSYATSAYGATLYGAYASDGAAAARAERRDSAAPVIVNQYFGSSDRDYARTEFQSSSALAVTDQAPALPGDPIGPSQNYYLIAYKDRSIYSALAYWVEDGTLHYVTTQNTHNQASLGLIDVEKTTKLNADNAVPFSIAR